MKKNYVQQELKFQEKSSRGSGRSLRLKAGENPDRLHVLHFLDDFSTPKKILELGCGNGRFSFLLAEMFPQCTFVCTDLCWSKVQECHVENSYPNLRFQVADTLNLPFADGSFDIAAGFYILHHLPDVSLSVKEIRRVLKYNGLYIGCEPNCYNPYLFLRIASRINLSPNEKPVLPHVYRRFFERSGWKTEIDYFFPRFPAIKNQFLSSCCSFRATNREGGS